MILDIMGARYLVTDLFSGNKETSIKIEKLDTNDLQKIRDANFRNTVNIIEIEVVV